ncbi:Dehydration-responsive element-binding protein 1F [Linum perenne]
MQLQLASEVPKRRTGRRVLKETRHPVFRGVRSRNGDKWVSELRLPKKETRVWLGTYPTPEMAARAHDVASIAFRGKSACLNFADSAWRLPFPASLDPKDVRKAAADAAEMFRPQSFPPVEECSISSFSAEVNGLCNYNYVDEEEVLEMPRLLSEMAEGLLMCPPWTYVSETDNEWGHIVESDVVGHNNNWSLWN